MHGITGMQVYGAHMFNKVSNLNKNK